MPRKLRVQFEGAVYHVMNRGDRKEPIFRDDADRERFIQTLGETCAKTGWQVHALCLMGNHFHAVIETPRANLVDGMKWFLGTVTMRFNRRHRLTGHLFAGRYKAVLVDGDSPGYFRTVCDYVHLNPVRAKLLKEGQPLSSYAWSSYRQYLEAPGRRWAWLRTDRLLGEMGFSKDSAAARQAFRKQMEARRESEGDHPDWDSIRNGWFFGSDELRQELLAKATTRVGAQNFGRERRETDEQKAELLVGRELRRRGWAEKDLVRLPKGDAGKVAIARQLRSETTMTLKWIASRLKMGAWTYVSNLLRQQSDSVNSKD